VKGGKIKVVVQNCLCAQDKSIKDGTSIPAGKYVRITIQDYGAGISEENLSKIFEPYFTTKTLGAEKGVGLGLSLVYSIIKRHNGYITVNSKSGLGATIDLYLVAEIDNSYTPRSVHTNTSPAQFTDEERILVMDDEEMIRNFVTSMFEHLGYKVDTVKNGQEAIDSYTSLLNRGKRYKLVILDLAITDGMGGKQTLEQLHARDSGVRAVVSSGYSNDPVVENYSDFGFIGALSKPYTITEAKNLLARISHQQR
jgi:CheY-like chemotaxis protein